MSKNVEKPHFYFEDLKAADFKETPYFDPYHRLRHPVEPERLKLIYQQAFIYDLLYSFAKEYLPDVKNLHENDTVQDSNNKQTDTRIDLIKEKVLEYLFKNEVVKSDEFKTAEMNLGNDSNDS